MPIQDRKARADKNKMEVDQETRSKKVKFGGDEDDFVDKKGGASKPNGRVVTRRQTGPAQQVEQEEVPSKRMKVDDDQAVSELF